MGMTGSDYGLMLMMMQRIRLGVKSGLWDRGIDWGQR